MTDNVTLPGTGAVIRSVANGSVETQVVKLDVGGESAESLVTSSNPVPVSANATQFTFSVTNSTTAQLAPGTTFFGAVESILNQQMLSINLTMDQPGTLIINQYVDAAGANLISSWTYPIAAGIGFNQAWTANGNYHKLMLTNNGLLTTTTLNLSTAYGTEPPVSQLGNTPVAINEVAGTAVTAAGIPVQVISSPPVVDPNTGKALSPDDPFFTVITGDPNGDWAGVNLLEALMDSGPQGSAINVVMRNTLKADTSGATILSDCVGVGAAGSAQILAPVGATIIIDTTGYESVNITTQTLAGNVTASNDLKTFSALTGTPLVLGAYVTAIAANLGYCFPCIARYLVITPTVAGTATAYLRSAPWNGSYTTSVATGVPTAPTLNTVNASQWGGSAVVSGGVAGTIAAGGATAAGIAPTTNPLSIAGVDALGLGRRVLMDVSGAAIAAGVTPQAGATWVPPPPVRVVAAAEGTAGNQMTELDTLQLILQYMASTEFWIRQLPLYLNNGWTVTDDFQRDDIVNSN